jgi:hypothetical protein
MTLGVNFCRAISRNVRLLYPTKLPRRSFAIEAVTGQKQTHAVQQIGALFDHLVGAGEQCGRHGDAEQFRGLEIDH